jgi:hypothetical protein
VRWVDGLLPLTAASLLYVLRPAGIAMREVRDIYHQGVWAVADAFRRLYEMIEVEDGRAASDNAGGPFPEILVNVRVFRTFGAARAVFVVTTLAFIKLQTAPAPVTSRACRARTSAA